MKSKTLTSAIRVLSLLLLVSGTCALAQERSSVHFSGLINDYSPASVKGEPWEIHGQWSMVNGTPPRMGHRRLRSGYDDVGLWEDLGRCCRSDAGRSGASHAPYQVDERHGHLGHDRLPHCQPCNHNGFSGERHGQPVDGEWRPGPLRNGSTVIDAAGLCHRRDRGAVLERFAGVWRACDYTFRATGHPRRRAQSVDRLDRESIGPPMNDQSG